MVVKEALACNLPIVATDVGMVPSLLDGVEGCYIASQTPEDFAAKIRLVLDRGVRIEGRETIRDLALDRTAQRVVDVYRQVLGR